MISFKSFLKPLFRSGTHAGADIIVNNTIGAYVKQTPTKADDAALEDFAKPELHKFIDMAFDGFKNIDVKYYFIKIWTNILTSMCNLELLEVLKADIEARIEQLKAEPTKESEAHTWIERDKK